MGGGMTSVLQVVQNIAQFLTGPFGISMAAIGLATFAIGGMFGYPWQYFYRALGCISVLFCCGWIVNMATGAG